MCEPITPAFLEACGFKKHVGFRSASTPYVLESEHSRVEAYPTGNAWDFVLTKHGESILIHTDDRSRLRSAWHALTGTRLVEPMPTDIAESTLIACDFLDDHGWNYQADYLRYAIEEREKFRSENQRLTRIANGVERFNESFNAIFSDGSATEGTPVWECRSCRNRLRDSYCSRAECRYGQGPQCIPIGVGNGAGLPLISAGTIRRDVYDRLPPEFQRMFTRDESERTRAGVFNRNTGQHSPRPRFANDSYRFRYCEQCCGCTQHMFLSNSTAPSFYECQTCGKSGYVAPVDATRRVPMIRSSAGLRPAFDGERVDGFALAKDLEDALNHVTEFNGELFPASGEHQPNAYV